MIMIDFFNGVILLIWDSARDEFCKLTIHPLNTVWTGIPVVLNNSQKNSTI